MKSQIHPQYFSDSKVSCACGNTWKTGSTLNSINVEICDKCHPFFTGKDKKVDRRGRLERFQKRSQQFETKSKVSGSKTKKRLSRATKKSLLDNKKMTKED